MLPDFDAAIKARFLVYLNQEMLFIDLYPANAHSSHAAALLMIEAMGRTEMITSVRQGLLIAGIDSALLRANTILLERQAN
jgi:hypothetical protein